MRLPCLLPGWGLRHEALQGSHCARLLLARWPSGANLVGSCQANRHETCCGPTCSGWCSQSSWCYSSEQYQQCSAPERLLLEWGCRGSCLDCRALCLDCRALCSGSCPWGWRWSRHQRLRLPCFHPCVRSSSSSSRSFWGWARRRLALRQAPPRLPYSGPPRPTPPLRPLEQQKLQPQPRLVLQLPSLRVGSRCASGQATAASLSAIWAWSQG